MARIFTSRLIFLPVLLISLQVYAGQPVWTAMGPFGGSLRSVQFSPVKPGLVFAAAQFSGVFVSKDGGVSWMPDNTGLVTARQPGQQTPVVDFAFDFNNPDIVYAASGANVYRWMANTNTWTLLYTVPNEGVAALGQVIEYISVDTFNSNHIILTGNFSGGAIVLESFNGGTTFKGANRFVASGKWYFSQVRPGLVFNSGSSRSVDDGKTWTSIPYFERSVATDPDRLYGSGLAADHTVHLVRSDDGGVTFNDLGKPPVALGGLQDVFRDPSNPDVAYISGTVYNLMKTSDKGATWTTVNFPFDGEDTIAVVVDPFNSQHILVVNADVYASWDGGQTFLLSDTGLHATEISTVAVDDSVVPVIYASENEDNLYGHIFRSVDGGASWERFDDGRLFGYGIGYGDGIQSMATDQVNRGYIYSGTSQSLDLLLPGGTSWSSLGTIDGQLSVATPPAVGGVVYLGISGLFVGTLIAVSADYGTTWQTIYSNPFGSECATPNFAFSYVDSNVIYRAQDCVIDRTTDGGLTWSVFPLSSSQLNDVVSMATSTVDDHTLFAIDRFRTARTLDNGTNWITVCCNPEEDLFSLSTDPNLSSTVYLGTGNGLMISTDNGDTWSQAPGLEHHLVQSVIHPTWNNTVYYAATKDAGAFTLIQPTDLSLTLLGAGGQVAVATPVAYTVIVANNGNVSASPAAVDLRPSANETLTMVNSGGATCRTPASAITGELVCDLASLATGATWTLTLQIMLTAAQPGTLQASAGVAQGDSNWDNNAETATIHGEDTSDFTVAIKPISQNIVTNQGAALFAVTVNNAGLNADGASLYVFYDTTAVGIQVTAPGVNCTPNGTGYICKINSLAPGESRNLTFTGSVTTPGLFSASALVVPTATTDNNGGNNRSFIQMDVSPPTGPTVKGAVSQTISLGSPTSPETLTLTGVEPLTVSFASNDTTLLPSSAIKMSSGCGMSSLSCTITLAPAINQTGTAVITVAVQDKYRQSASEKFSLTVSKSASGGGGTKGGGGGVVSVLELLAICVAIQRRRNIMRLDS